MASDTEKIPHLKRRGGRRLFTRVLAVLLGILALYVAIWLVDGTIRYGLYSRVSEAQNVLHGTITAQLSFQEQYGMFVATGIVPPLPAIRSKRSWTESPCPSTCSRPALVRCASFECLGYRPSGDVYYSYACTATRTPAGSDVTCAAVSDLDGDGYSHVFVLAASTRAGATSSLAPIPRLGDLGRCRDPAPIGDLVECHEFNRNVFVRLLRGRDPI